MRLLPLIAVLAIGCTKESPAPAPAPAAPPVFAAAHPAPGGTTAGRVLETFEAPGYTYLRLSTSSGEQWAAIPTASVAVGSQVRLINPMPMQNFVSKTLNRTFAEILFASGLEQDGAPAAFPAKAPAAEPELAALEAWAKKDAPAAAAVAVAVPKATGADGKTVAEIYGQRAALAGKTVALRGKVVKVTSGVLGKNWLHLRDGSGSSQAKDDDITVTTTDQAAIGDVVVATGPVRVDRDFGAGYLFAVMIEDAKLAR